MPSSEEDQGPQPEAMPQQPEKKPKPRQSFSVRIKEHISSKLRRGNAKRNTYDEFDEFDMAMEFLSQTNFLGGPRSKAPPVRGNFKRPAMAFTTNLRPFSLQETQKSPLQFPHCHELRLSRS